jgi:nitroreductase
MEFQDVVRKRRMVRRFRADKPLPEEVVARLLDNATRGPSAGFSQGQAFLALRGDDLRRFWGIGDAWAFESVQETAQLVIVPLACKQVYLDRYSESDKGWTDKAESHWPVPYWHIDTGMAALLILQTAVDEGLGALLFGIGPDDTDKFREEFGVPADHDPIGAIAIGYPDEPKPHPESSAATRPRRDRGAVIHHGNW